MSNLAALLILVVAVGVIGWAVRGYRRNVRGWPLPVGSAAAAAGLIALIIWAGVISLLIIALIAAIVYALWQWTDRQAPWAVTTMVCCGMLLVVVIVWVAHRNWPDPERVAIEQPVEDSYWGEKGLYYGIGQDLATRYRQCYVLVFRREDWQDNAASNALIAEYIDRGSRGAALMGPFHFYSDGYTPEEFDRDTRVEAPRCVALFADGLPAALDLDEVNENQRGQGLVAVVEQVQDLDQQLLRWLKRDYVHVIYAVRGEVDINSLDLVASGTERQKLRTVAMRIFDLRCYIIDNDNVTQARTELFGFGQ